MKKKLPKLSASEIEIMTIVWEKGETTISEVLEELNSKRPEAVRRTTIQVQMGRLEEKGWLAHTCVGRTFWYRATRNRGDARSDIVRDVRERVFGGSCSELLKCLFNDTRVSPEELRRLRKLVDQQEEDRNA